MKDVSVFDNLSDKGDCSKQTVQHKKKISDRASACTQRDDRLRMKVSEEECSW